MTDITPRAQPISALNESDTFEASDNVPISDTSAGATRRVTGATLLTYFQDNIVTQPNIQTASPLTGTTITLTDQTVDIWLILIPAGTIATLTITLPPSPYAGQEVVINTTQEVTALTVTAGSVPVTSAATALTLGADGRTGHFRMRYNDGPVGWYRVG